MLQRPDGWPTEVQFCLHYSHNLARASVFKGGPSVATTTAVLPLCAGREHVTSSLPLSPLPSRCLSSSLPLYRFRQPHQHFTLQAALLVLADGRVILVLVLFAATCNSQRTSNRRQRQQPQFQLPPSLQLLPQLLQLQLSRVNGVEASLVGLLPSVQLSRYLSRQQGSLNDPDTLLTTEQLIRREGYPVEVHTVRTGDGYLPTLVRIPKGLQANTSKRGPVLITHGLLQCSDNWVLRGRRKDLPFILADAGYDVWLANTRGSTISRKHEKMTAHDRAFWNFSLHEVGTYDVPAFIDHILSTTGRQQLHYIGHSMGSTIFYIMGSTRPDMMDKVSLAIHLAPVSYWTKILSPVAKRAFQFATVLKSFDMPMLFDNYASRNNRSIFLADYLCRVGAPTQQLCMEALFSLVGSDRSQLDPALLPMIFSHFPAGASLGQVTHFYENFEKGGFFQYDLGYEGNMQKYGLPSPPAYNLTRVTAPVAIWYGSNDQLVYKQDVEQLAKSLPNMVGVYVVDNPKFNHFDFLWAKDAKKLLYDPMMVLMAKF